MLTTVSCDGQNLVAESLDGLRSPDFDWDGVMLTAHSILLTLNYYYGGSLRRFESLTVIDHAARIPN